MWKAKKPHYLPAIYSTLNISVECEWFTFGVIWDCKANKMSACQTQCFRSGKMH